MSINDLPEVLRDRVRTYITLRSLDLDLGEIKYLIEVIGWPRGDLNPDGTSKDKVPVVSDAG